MKFNMIFLHALYAFESIAIMAALLENLTIHINSEVRK